MVLSPTIFPKFLLTNAGLGPTYIPNLFAFKAWLWSQANYSPSFCCQRKGFRSTQNIVYKHRAPLKLWLGMLEMPSYKGQFRSFNGLHEYSFRCPLATNWVSGHPMGCGAKLGPSARVSNWNVGAGHPTYIPPRSWSRPYSFSSEGDLWYNSFSWKKPRPETATCFRLAKIMGEDKQVIAGFAKIDKKQYELEE